MVNVTGLVGVKVDMGVLEAVGVPPPPPAPTVLVFDKVDRGVVRVGEIVGEKEDAMEGDIVGVLREEVEPFPPPPAVPVPEFTPEGVVKGGVEEGDDEPLPPPPPPPLKLAIPVLLPEGLPDRVPV